ncbi:galactitol-1-phosphate 5-dehydrogenase [Paenibacillus sp. IB182496]|uniref:Galactitol-1-phosphate 5-dehydrogenase n=1 Tax=Paenibacillus sabuli TaxID=2772509 RepID=A0A927BN46_9BACL|nr:galactitol-1-phosphate 5-dehydrogenase [Paenibacillus sabuli]MBD2843566.1 galactitol-1-phosphate 5-dehydrogenase [Paenibacillus sabuli]
MKALVYRGPRDLVLEELEQPVCGLDEVVIEVSKVGICGSELEGYLGHSSVRFPPLVMGHEFCGRVTELGANVAELSIGDKVAVNPLIACGRCDRCLSGKSSICGSRRIVGIHRPGAFARYVAVPAANAIRVPDGMDPLLGSLAEPLAVAVHAVKLGVQPLDEQLIYGAGPIGLLALQAAQCMGAGRVTVVDLQPARLAYAAELGARAVPAGELADRWTELFPDGVDVILDCVGAQPTREQAMKLINPGGRIVMVGLAQGVTPMPINDLVRQELSLLGSYTYSGRDFRQALDLLEAGRIRTDGWIETRPLSAGPDAFLELADGTTTAGKIVLDAQAN